MRSGTMAYTTSSACTQSLPPPKTVVWDVRGTEAARPHSRATRRPVLQTVDPRLPCPLPGVQRGHPPVQLGQVPGVGPVVQQVAWGLGRRREGGFERLDVTWRMEGEREVWVRRDVKGSGPRCRTAMRVVKQHRTTAPLPLHQPLLVPLTRQLVRQSGQHCSLLALRRRQQAGHAQGGEPAGAHGLGRETSLHAHWACRCHAVHKAALRHCPLQRPLNPGTHAACRLSAMPTMHSTKRLNCVREDERAEGRSEWAKGAGQRPPLPATCRPLP